MMHDPASDRSSLDEETYGRVFDYRVVMRIVPYLLPYKSLIAISLVALVVFTATQVAVPWLIKIGIDGYISVGDYSGLSLIVALFMSNALVGWGSNYLNEITLVRASQQVLYRLRRDMFAHLQRLSVTFADKNEVGRIMSRVQGDVYQVQEFLGVAVVTLGDLMGLAGIVVAVLLMNVKLGLISMVVLPMLFIVMAFWQPRTRKAFIRVRGAIAIVNGAFNENISGVRVVQAMNRQRHNLEQFEVKNRENLRAGLSASRLGAGLLPVVDVLSALSIGLAVFFGARMVIGNSMEVGTLVAFILYIQRFFEPIRSLTMQYTQLQRAMASGSRIFELLDTEPDLVDAPGAKVLPRLRGEIELRNVSYGYVPGQDVIRNLDLHIKPGEAVAIVGPTGAGKTTLVSLISRFYDVPRDKGAILVDGHDIRDVTRRSLAGQMGMVLQEPFLFSGSVRMNIKYNHADATDDAMIAATVAVGAHDFITRLEDGYDTYLHERGVNLSLGQRQLVSFARAIVADPRILILDEATANIDSYTEMLIQRALVKLLAGRTAIVIAHRLSTIRGADKIVVMDNGQIAEVGTHGQLIDLDGLYAHLYRMNYAAMEQARPLSTPEEQSLGGLGASIA